VLDNVVGVCSTSRVDIATLVKGGVVPGALEYRFDKQCHQAACNVVCTYASRKKPGSSGRNL
jgi:hypothetical protein